MGSYETWAQVLGGILKTASLENFLENVKRQRQDSDEDSAQLRAFCLAWEAKYQSKTVGVRELYTLLEEDGDLVPFVFDAKSEQGRRQKLGRFLSRMAGRVVGNNRITQLADDDRSGRKQYQLQPLAIDGEASLENGPKSRVELLMELLPPIRDKIYGPEGHVEDGVAEDEDAGDEMTSENINDFLSS